jgi:D-alanyl-D-alanine carboxypeptidase/D-alanyl-D-alanine-endopeptidase (penicillin-binding protein 4)
MTKLLCALIFKLALMLASFSVNAELPSTVVDALKKAGIQQDGVAVVVRSVEGGNPTLTHNGAKSLNPASVMKLVTTNAALDLLTPAYRWKTEIYRDGVVANGVLTGNLIIKAYGDPSFKSQEFWRLLMSLQQAGIKEIKGDLIIDKSFFSKNIETRNTFDNETWRAYNSMPSAFLVNGRNTSFKFTTIKSDLNVDHVNIVQEFEIPELQIINEMRVIPGPCGEWRNHMSYSVKAKTNDRLEVGKVVTFTGNFSPDCADKYLELSIFNDEQYAFYTFRKLWDELGGKFSGELKVQQNSQESPADAVKVSEKVPERVLVQMSAPLGDVVRDINKWSNNLMVRQLLLTIAAEKLSPPATEAKGAIVIKDWLSSKKFKGSALSFNKLVIENGSGLSRIERISAEHLSQMLVSAYNSPVMPELMSSLPILALDGTVTKRLKDSPVAGRAHLKTGSLDGVSAIAGYVLDKQDKRQVVVMIINHTKSSASKAAQDALIEWVYLSGVDRN